MVKLVLKRIKNDQITFKYLFINTNVINKQKSFQKRLVKDIKIFLKKKTKSTNMLVSDQGFYAPCFIIMNDWGWDRWGWLISIKVWVGGTRRGYFHVGIFLCFCLLFSCVSLVKWLEHDSRSVCFFIYYLSSLSLDPLTRSYWTGAYNNFFACHVKLFIKSVSDHYSVDFLEKGSFWMWITL